MGEIKISPEEYYEAVVKQTLKDQYKLADKDLSSAEKRFTKLISSGLSLHEAEQELYAGLEEKVSSITDKEGWVQKVNPSNSDIYKTPEKPDVD